MQIAILEDDPVVGTMLTNWLEAAQHRVTLFTCGADLLAHESLAAFEIFLLDWGLPDMSGLDVLRLLKSEKQIAAPMLFTTVRDDEADIVIALDAGADDYLVKPIRNRELLSRIRAVSRRVTRAPFVENSDVFGCYRFDYANQRVHCNGVAVNMQGREFELATFFFKNMGRILSRDLISNAVWGRPVAGESRTIDTHISHIRKKLDICQENGFLLTAIYSAGYRLEQTSLEREQ